MLLKKLYYAWNFYNAYMCIMISSQVCEHYIVLTSKERDRIIKALRWLDKAVDVYESNKMEMSVPYYDVIKASEIGVEMLKREAKVFNKENL